MVEREAYPSGVPCWVDSEQPDPDAARAFYGGLFGWTFEDQMPPGAPGPYFLARLDGHDVAGISFQMEEAPAAWNTYVAVEDADETAKRIVAAGGAVVVAPMDVLDAGRLGVFTDPQGAAFSIWQPGRLIGARAVNVANSWNWSNLHTEDPAGAQAFYGAIFDWELDDGLWRCPGYGTFLEQADPGLRVRHAQYGAPEGFADAIARQGPLAPGEPAHWSVTFAVADADAVAQAALRLGGSVVTEPVDLGGVARVAVLRDPQGAPFEISCFDPR